MVVPVATAATAITGTGFTANWTVPAIGTVDNGYRVEVSTVSTFASVISGSPFTVASGLSQVVTGLAAGTTYYYRVRADKTSVTTQGAPFNVITATTCAPPVAIAQNVTLNSSGTASTTATAVNNGSHRQLRYGGGWHPEHFAQQLQLHRCDAGHRGQLVGLQRL